MFQRMFTGTTSLADVCTSPFSNMFQRMFTEETISLTRELVKPILSHGQLPARARRLPLLKLPGSHVLPVVQDVHRVALVHGPEGGVVDDGNGAKEDGLVVPVAVVAISCKNYKVADDPPNFICGLYLIVSTWRGDVEH